MLSSVVKSRFSATDPQSGLAMRFARVVNPLQGRAYTEREREREGPEWAD